MRVFEGLFSVNHRGNLSDYSSDPHVVVAALRGLTLKVGVSDFARENLAATYDYVMGSLTDAKTYRLHDPVVSLLSRCLWDEFHEVFREKAKGLHVCDEALNAKINEYLKKKRSFLEAAAESNGEKILRQKRLCVYVDGERVSLSEKRQRRTANAFIDRVACILAEAYREALSAYGTDLSTSVIFFSDGIAFDLIAERMRTKRICDLAGQDVAVLWFDEPSALVSSYLYFFDDPGGKPEENGLISVRRHYVSGGRIISRDRKDRTPMTPASVRKESGESRQDLLSCPEEDVNAEHEGGTEGC